MKNQFEKKDDREKYTLPYHWTIEPFSKRAAHYMTYSTQVIELLPPPPLEILDVGCGDGKIANLLVKRGDSVTGIDISEKAIAFAKFLVPEATFLVANVIQENNGLTTQNFDAVILNAVLEHIHPGDRDQMLKQVHDLLRNTGVFILSVPTPAIPASPYHYNHFEMTEIQFLLESNNFMIDHIIYSHNMRHITSKLLFSSWSKLIQNRWYDLTFLRRLIVQNFKRYAAEAKIPEQAGMLVIRSKKKNVQTI